MGYVSSVPFEPQKCRPTGEACRIRAMFKLALGTLAVLLASLSARTQTPPHRSSPAPALTTPQMPSEEEIGELLSKASEYVNSYRQIFTNAKPSLDKAPTPGFYEKAMELSTQAAGAIGAIQKTARPLMCWSD
jgi:hypothetical protein